LAISCIGQIVTWRVESVDLELGEEAREHVVLERDQDGDQEREEDGHEGEFSLKNEKDKRVQGALQLLINRYGQIRFAQVPERVSTKSFVVLIIGNSKSFHLGAQGTFKG